MNIIDIEQVESECRRFLATAAEAKARLRRDCQIDGHFKPETYNPVTGLKETAACKRASMDLSRALVKLRR